MLETRIREELRALEEIYDKYAELNKDTRRYKWRMDAIAEQIDMLEYVLEGRSMALEWTKCFAEDEIEAGRESNI